MNRPHPCAAVLCVVLYSQSAAPSALMYGKTDTWGGFLASNKGERGSPLAVLRDLCWSLPAAAVGWAGGKNMLTYAEALPAVIGDGMTIKQQRTANSLSKADLQLLKIAHREELVHKIHEKKEYTKVTRRRRTPDPSPLSPKTPIPSPAPKTPDPNPNPQNPRMRRT